MRNRISPRMRTVAWRHAIVSQTVGKFVSRSATVKLTMTDKDGLIDEASVKTTEDASRAISREELYELVWAKPMLKVAARFDVSSSYLARVCGLLRVPRPPRGYWAKLAVGKASRKPPLPGARPGDETHWRRDPYWHSDPELSAPRATAAEGEDAEVLSPPKNSTPPRNHPLLKGAKALLLTGGRSRDMRYLKPNKKYLVDLVVTERLLSKALSFANELYSAFESHGYTVTLAPAGERLQRSELDVRTVASKHGLSENLWSPHRCTVVYVGKLAIGLTIFEPAEEVEMRYVGDGQYAPVSKVGKPKPADGMSWTTKRDVPTGRLAVQAYCPYMHADWTQQWYEEKSGQLSTQIPEIITALRSVAPTLVDQVEEGRRKAEAEYREWEAQNEAWRREAAEKAAAEALKKRREELLALIAEWDEARRIEAFFRDAMERIQELPEPERTILRIKMEQAMQLVGDTSSTNRLRAWAGARGS